MAPKAKAWAAGKGKAKAKGKAKGGGKGAKGKAKAKAVAEKVAEKVAAAAAVAEEAQKEIAVAEEEASSKPSAKPSAARKKVLASLGEKSLEETIEEYKMLLQKSDAVVVEADALRAAQNTQIQNAQAEYDKVQKDVVAASNAEVEAATAFKAAKEKKDGKEAKIAEARSQLMEAEKKVAMLEVMYENARRMKELDEKRRVAVQGAEAAKAKVVLMKQREKAALEATKVALLQARQQAMQQSKGMGRAMAAKRPLETEGEPLEKKAATETLPDTVPGDIAPATLPVA